MTAATHHTAAAPLREPLLVKIAEAARLLAVDARTIRRLIARGELETTNEGKLRRVTMASVHAYVSRHRQGGRDA